MHIWMPRRRSARRKLALSYPRSATSLSGRRLGRPRGRATRIVSKVCSASRTSAWLALSRWKPRGSPLPSTTSIHLVPLPFFVRPTFSPPFFAGANAPSRKAMDQSSAPRWSREASAARQMRSHTPSSVQRLSRRQAVVGAPYSRGRSCQRQPVVSTKRMPSMVRRSSARGRPVRAGGGRKERMKSHCLSVR